MREPGAPERAGIGRCPTGEAGGLVRLTDRSLDAVLAAARGVLVLTRTTCPACAGYQAEVAGLPAQGRLAGIAVGTLAPGRPGAGRFKRENPWLAGVRALPYRALYRRGARVDAFAASRGAYLLERAAAAFGAGAAAPPLEA